MATPSAFWNSIRAYSFGQLSTIRRQLRADYLEVVELAANQKPEAALQRLEQMGAALKSGPLGYNASLYQSAADAYLQSVNKGKTALLVSADVGRDRGCHRASPQRAQAPKPASASPSIPSRRLDSPLPTEAQKRNVHQKIRGRAQKILFLRDGHGFAKNQTAEVVEAGLDPCLRVSRKKMEPPLS